MPASPPPQSVPQSFGGSPPCPHHARLSPAPRAHVLSLYPLPLPPLAPHTHTKSSTVRVHPFHQSFPFRAQTICIPRVRDALHSATFPSPLPPRPPQRVLPSSSNAKQTRSPNRP